MFKGLGQLGDMARMMKTAKEMQERMAALQEELAAIEVEGTAGGGLVKARVTAKAELRGVEIDPSILRPEDREVVEDLVLAAISDAQEKAAERAREEMAKITAELGLPADLKLPF